MCQLYNTRLVFCPFGASARTRRLNCYICIAGDWCYTFGMRPWHLFLCMMVLQPCSSGFPAQESGKPASIVLQVTDQGGAVVPDARVLILPLPKSVAGMLKTDKDGRVSLVVPSGAYTLRVQMLGFRPARKRIEAEPGSHQAISIELTVGVCTQCVEVIACPATGCPSPPSFPEQSRVASPDGRYLLMRKGWPWAGRHTVELEDRVLKTRHELFKYNQRVVFQWWGRLIIATDYAGSHVSHATLYSVDKQIPPVQVLDLLLSQIDEDDRKVLVEALTNRRVCVEALGFGFDGMASWWGSGLGAKVSAYGPKGTLDFEWTYAVQLPAT